MTDNTSQQQRPTKKRRTRRNIILVGLAVILVTALALIFLLPRGPHKTIANETTKAIDNSQIGQTVDRVVPANRLISTMVTPANATWWKNIAHYVAQFDLLKVPYEKLQQPTELGLVTLYSTNEDYNSSFFLATPAVILTYKTNAAAAKAQSSIFSVKNSKVTYGVYQLDNNLVLLPGNTIAENLLTVKKYVKADNPTPVQQAYWHIDWNNLNSYMHSVQTSSYRATYDKILGYVGTQTTPGVKSYWDGTSTDGRKWTGEVNTSDNSPAIDAAKFNPAKIMSTISSTGEDQYFQDENGDVASYGITIPHQSAVLNHLTISTNKTALGNYIDPETATTSKAKKTTNPNDVIIKFDPNRWFQYMSRDVSNAYFFFYYRTLTVTLHGNTNDMDLTFSQPSLPVD